MGIGPGQQFGGWGQQVWEEPLLRGGQLFGGTSLKASAPGDADFLLDTGEAFLLPSQFSPPVLRVTQPGDSGSVLYTVLVSVRPSKHGVLSCFLNVPK